MHAYELNKYSKAVCNYIGFYIPEPEIEVTLYPDKKNVDTLKYRVRILTNNYTEYLFSGVINANALIDPITLSKKIIAEYLLKRRYS